MTHFTNQRKISTLSKIKSVWIKCLHGKSVELKKYLIVLGNIPHFKIPGKSKIILGDRIVFDSDFKRSNIPLTQRCKLVCGTNAIVEIGDNTILNGVGMTAYKKIKIGKNCLISSGSYITDTDLHPINPELRKLVPMGYKIDFDTVTKKEILIGDNVWIGWGAIILKGVTIGDNSIISAGSVVTSAIPANVIAGGNPAKIIRQL